MGVFSRTRRLLGYLFDLRVDRWIGYSGLKSSIKRTRTLWNTRASPVLWPEDFETARIRAGLSPEDLIVRRRTFQRLGAFFTLLAGCCVIHALSHFWRHPAPFAIAMSILLAGYAGLQALQFYLWAFQIQHARCDLSLKDWIRYKRGAMRALSKAG